MHISTILYLLNSILSTYSSGTQVSKLSPKEEKTKTQITRHDKRSWLNLLIISLVWKKWSRVTMAFNWWLKSYCLFLWESCFCSNSQVIRPKISSKFYSKVRRKIGNPSVFLWILVLPSNSVALTSNQNKLLPLNKLAFPPPPPPPPHYLMLKPIPSLICILGCGWGGSTVTCEVIKPKEENRVTGAIIYLQ